jgi:2-phosphoglycerate kinase
MSTQITKLSLAKISCVPRRETKARTELRQREKHRQHSAYKRTTCVRYIKYLDSTAKKDQYFHASDAKRHGVCVHSVN